MVGKPGSSKTLAVQIVRDNLDNKNIGRFIQNSGYKKKTLRVLHIISFQCSKQSKAYGIKKRWKQAVKQYDLNNPEYQAVLLLDEIGLAEKSPYRPLKILHQLLEDPKIAFVGLSNWSLDAAKMNRCIMHKCPELDINDLKDTAMAILKQRIPEGQRQDTMKAEIEHLSTIYLYCKRTFAGQEEENDDTNPNVRPEFFGARDFYALVRHYISTRWLKEYNKNDGFGSGKQPMLIAFFRNFGGIPQKYLKNYLAQQIERLLHYHDVGYFVEEFNACKCVESNLNDRRTLRKNETYNLFAFLSTCSIQQRSFKPKNS